MVTGYRWSKPCSSYSSRSPQSCWRSKGYQSFQLLNCDQLFATLWTVARQASLSITSTRSLFKLMSIESVMWSKHLILCCPFLLLTLIFSSIRVFFSISQFFASGGQSIGVSASASVLPMNIQDWFPLGLTGLILQRFTVLTINIP